MHKIFVLQFSNSYSTMEKHFPYISLVKFSPILFVRFYSLFKIIIHEFHNFTTFEKINLSLFFIWRISRILQTMANLIMKGYWPGFGILSNHLLKNIGAIFALLCIFRVYLMIKLQLFANVSHMIEFSNS